MVLEPLEFKRPDQWAIMWKDLTIVVQDLRKIGWKPGRLKKTFGLSWRELRGMIGSWR